MSNADWPCQKTKSGTFSRKVGVKLRVVSAVEGVVGFNRSKLAVMKLNLVSSAVRGIKKTY